MNDSPSPEPPVASIDVPQAERPADRWSWLDWALLIAAAAVVFARLRLLDLPLERDEGEYAYGAQLLRHGGMLYRDLHSMKWPGIYAAYAAILGVGGENRTAIHAGLLVLNCATAAGLFLFARTLVDRTCALFAAVMFMVLSVLPVMHGIIANAEHFSMLFPMFGLWRLSLGLQTRSAINIFIAGTLVGLGPVMKQHAIVFVVLGGVETLLLPWTGVATSIKSRLTRAAIYSAGVFLVWGIMLLAIWRHGALSEFWLWTVQYPREYTSQIPVIAAPVNFFYSAVPILWITWPVCLLALVGLIYTLRSGAAEHRFWSLGLLLAGIVAICPGFYFREHYFLLLAPAMAFLSALGVQALRREMVLPDHPHDYSVANTIGLVAIFLPLLFQGKLLFLDSSRAVSRTLYGLNPFVESPDVAAYLSRVMPPDAKLVIFGSEPQIAFESQRRLATGHVYMYPLMEIHPLAATMQRQMIDEVTAARPEFAVVATTRTSWLPRPNSEPFLADWMGRFLRDYDPVGVVTTQTFENSESTFSEDGTPLPNPAAAVGEHPNYVMIYRRKPTR
ncbi:ArnT family glycosyltransferase [Planctomicrobium piriforme]|uniref:Glycosyltransferase RgtA/B/C/D-like domain-containing protein n=1 Tax=Planctomicrobium piriforme TaxID=1576369 RepID=A0A1I3L6X4_9PLAN|nr:glycosyltransferase family 39 protein [Planctomicrobium piriforme]SFI80461.1 hypothetical protein SAMN05421753_112159 [Planctomicrobium piriforme]